MTLIVLIRIDHLLQWLALGYCLESLSPVIKDFSKFSCLIKTEELFLVLLQYFNIKLNCERNDEQIRRRLDTGLFFFLSPFTYFFIYVWSRFISLVYFM